MRKNVSSKKIANETTNMSLKSLNTRLDAIVLLLVRLVFGDAEQKPKITEVAPLLHIAGYTPTEIAKLLGKKKATEVAPYLYPKKK